MAERESLMFLVDTAVLWELRKGYLARPGVREWADTVNFTECFVSAFTLAEIERDVLRREAERPDEGKLLREWFDSRVLTAFEGRVLGFGAAEAQVFARLMEQHPSVVYRYQRVAGPLAVMDALEAATAVAHGLSLMVPDAAVFTGFRVPVLTV